MHRMKLSRWAGKHSVRLHAGCMKGSAAPHPAQQKEKLLWTRP